MIDQIDDLITANHRAKQNQMRIANSPVLKHRLGAKLNPGNLKFVPGQMYPVMNMNLMSTPKLPPKYYNLDPENQD